MILLPTVVMNSSIWGQCDAIYVTFCVGSVYFLIKKRPWLAAAFFGVAFTFKLQAIFFLPVLVMVLIVNRHRLRSLLAAFVDRWFIAVAAGIPIASISTYLSYLDNASPLSLGMAAAVAIGAGVLAAIILVRRLNVRTERDLTRRPREAPAG